MANDKTPFSTADAKKRLQAAAEKAPKVVQAHLDIKLSPYQAHSDTLLHSTNSGAGTYHRSGKHTQLKQMETASGKDNEIFKDHPAELTRDKRAHVGAYNNNFQRLGDLAWDKKEKKAEETSEGDAVLYNHLIHYRQTTCQHILHELTHLRPLKHLKVNYFHEYPCLMIYVEKSSAITTRRQPTKAALEAWSGFLLNYLMGAINAIAGGHNIAVEMVRRASFGFLSPTLSPTDQSIRLNVGIIPGIYQSFIVTALLQLDEVLEKIKTDIANALPIPDQHWFRSDSYKKYREKPSKKVEVNAIENLVQLLWEPADNAHQTTLQNIMRTAHAQDGIHKVVYEFLMANPNQYTEAMKAAIHFATSQFAIVKNALSFSQTTNVQFTIPFEKRDALDDKPFWDCITHIHESVTKLPGKIAILKTALNTVKIACDEGDLYQLYAKLEAVQDAILVQAGYLSTALPLEDGYGSDSEDEYEINGRRIHSRKIIVSNGMRAILCALIGASLDKKSLEVFLDKAYYEVPAGLDLLKPVNGVTVKKMTRPSEAAIAVTDATPCIADNKPQRLSMKFKGKEREWINNAVQIVDTTSASIEKMHEHVETFAQSRSPLLCLASSGTKNEQMGSDMNSYGTIRLFADNKSRLEMAINRIRTLEEPIRSPISHQHRRLMKTIGAAPTNHEILRCPKK